FSSGRCGCFFGLSVGHVNHIARLAGRLVGILSTIGCTGWLAGRLVLLTNRLGCRLILVGRLGWLVGLAGGCLAVLFGRLIGQRPTKVGFGCKHHCRNI